ncbi:MAG TPA: hypothetical protein VGQ52_21470 [Gemmatimonadaceae bacterium]|nr:hypothetical protein [Gemmatimonadaceae bacterium]
MDLQGRDRALADAQTRAFESRRDHWVHELPFQPPLFRAPTIGGRRLTRNADRVDCDPR